MTVNLAEKYEKALDQRWVKGSYTDNWINKKYNFDGVKSINVYTVTSVAPTDYDRTDTGDRYGGMTEVQDTIATYTLTKDKSFKLAIDRGNLEEQERVKKAAEVLKLEIDEQIIPMIDKDRIATACAGAAAVDQVITASADAYEDTLDANVLLDEDQAPVQGRALFVTPDFYKGIKLSIEKEINASDYNDKLVGRGFVGTLDGIPVIKVPTSYFPAGYKAVLIHRDALLGARKINEARVKNDSEFISGALLLGRYIFGSFVLDAKKKGVVAIAEGETPSGE